MFLRTKLETQEYLELVAEVDTIIDRRNDKGGKVGEDDADRLRKIERRLVQLVTASDEMDEQPRGMRLFCDMSVRLKTGGQEASAVVADIGTGGVFIGTDIEPNEGAEVTLLLNNTWPHFKSGESLKGRVAWVARGDQRRGMGVAFAEMDTQADASLRLQIIDLLRTHVNVHSPSARAIAN